MPDASSPVPGIVLSIIGIVFAAVSVWLTVRIVNRREKWAKWTLAAVLLAPIVYYASCGPALYISLKAGEPDWMEPVIVHGYAPVRWVTESSDTLRAWHLEYVELWMKLALD